MELSGRLLSFPIAELLTWAANDRRTGALVLRRSSREKRIYFRDGKIVACLSDWKGEFYGKHLLLEGYVSEDALLRCLLMCKDKGRRLGAILADEGILDVNVVERTLGEQIEDLICDVFLWNRGIFFFQADPPPEEEILARPINTMAVVLEGTRWVDEMRGIRKVIAHDHVVLGRAKADKPDKLSPRAAAIWRELEDPATVRNLSQAIGGSSYRLLFEAYKMIERGLIEISDASFDGPTGTFELPLATLLREQAAEPQLPLPLRDVGIPLRLLGPYYPVWSREGVADEWKDLSDSERELLQRFDGRRPLQDILSQNLNARSREAELLLLLISRGALAFIPPPQEELKGEEMEAYLAVPPRPKGG